MQTLFLKTKLLPPSEGSGQLERPRLEQRLAAGLERNATLVLSGPGYGKTTLVARFVERRPESSVWLRLDPTDTDPWMVLRYLIEGLRRHEPEFAAGSAGLWDALRERDEPAERLTDVFIRDAEEALSERVLVVLDGVDALTAAPGTRQMLNRLLDYLPGTLHPILVGRITQKNKLKAPARLVHRIAMDELRFTRDETRELLVDCWKLDCEAAVVERLHARTRGWITALQLLARTPGLEPAADIPADLFDRNESEVFDYFSDAVFEALEPDAREVLLAAALPSNFSTELLEDVLEATSIRPIIHALAQQRLFISQLEGSEELFEFDPLFRDFLRKKLRASRTNRGVQELQRRFGQAFDRRGHPAVALEHLIASEDSGAIATSLVQSGKKLVRERFLDLVSRAATTVLADGPGQPLVHDLMGEVARLRGDYGKAVANFEAALQPDAVPALTGTERASSLQGLAHARLKLGEVDIAESTARTALTEAGEDDALKARILNSLAVALYRRGAMDEAIESWQEALLRSRRGGQEDLTLMIAHNLGLPHAMMGDFDRASDCFRMLTDPKLGRLEPETGAAMLNVARIATLRGEYPVAARLLDDAWELSRKWGLRSLAADVLEAQGTLLRESGELAEARQKYTDARAQFTELGLMDLVANIDEEEAILIARLGEPERGERIADDLINRADSHQDDEGRASAQLALGEIRAAHGEARRALEPLAAAAGYYRNTHQAYQECAAELWMALAALRGGDSVGAQRAAGVALALSSRFRYGGVLTRITAEHPELAALLAGHSECSEALRTALTATRPTAAVPLGAVSPSGFDLRICLLGPVEVYRDEDSKIPDSAWKIKRALNVFCYLACARGHRATKDRIVEAVWADAAPAAVEKNFHPTVSFLRKALNHGHSATKNFILFESGAYRLNADYRYFIDVEAFETAIHSARERADDEDKPGALDRYDSALALWRGEFLEERFDDWADAHRQRYATLYREALREAGEMHLGSGNLERCIDYLRRLVEHDRIDEQVSVHLMLALGSLGRRPDVEREFQRLSVALDRELAASPSAATLKAYRHAMTD